VQNQAEVVVADGHTSGVREGLTFRGLAAALDLSPHETRSIDGKVFLIGKDGRGIGVVGSVRQMTEYVLAEKE
jgi:hypothetical protein